ncbi:hypothetical protein HNP46_003899 [Pseudomonas nitritireducens]|uniref:DUF4124 domain-containing protein n=1 Tax=Pseudomonas nitroreducens TaxID=46680 RepID=A0A7W7KMU9_PSENT|nr:DUF4124 domain-containing protein [Pseudomonas nitritireducens]MBB4865023.1 hypothetical protein [Pseudomonas nitritireducens]
MRCIAVLWLSSFFAVAQAATLNKCDDGQGHFTFTQQACADGTGGQQIKVVPATEGMRVGPPGGRPAQAIDDYAQPSIGEPDRGLPPAGQAKQGYTVVGAEPASSCSAFTEKDIRAAQVRKQVLPGMQAADVQGAWGSPSRKDDRQWVFQIDACMAWFVELDANGCVTGTRKGDSPVGLRCDDLMYKQRLERERSKDGSSAGPAAATSQGIN